MYPVGGQANSAARKARHLGDFADLHTVHEKGRSRDDALSDVGRLDHDAELVTGTTAQRIDDGERRDGQDEAYRQGHPDRGQDASLAFL